MGSSPGVWLFDFQHLAFRWRAAPGWHGPWSEATQADWLEAIYTIVYSKPEFEAIGWWDLTDNPGHFWPHGGLLNADLTPKLAYARLGDLQKSWGVSLTS